VTGCIDISSFGGNAFVVRMLNRYRQELGRDGAVVGARGDRKATIRQLQEDTAEVSIARTELAAES